MVAGVGNKKAGLLVFPPLLSVRQVVWYGIGSILISYNLINIHLYTTASLADTATPPGSSGVALLRVQQHVLADLRRDAVVRARVDQLMI